MEKKYSSSLQSIILCMRSGARLSNHVIQSSVRLSEKQCIQECVRSEDCVSLNYVKRENLCELNDVVWSDYFLTQGVEHADYDISLDSDNFIHYTSGLRCRL